MEYLYLDENNLTNLNPSFGKLPNLGVLDLSKNAITAPKTSIIFNENIQSVDLRENSFGLFNIQQQNIRDLVEQGIIRIDEFRLHDSVRKTSQQYEEMKRREER